MARVKRGVTAKARHKKMLNKAKGYYGSNSRTYRSAKQAVTRAGVYAYRDRRVKKREFRSLWIIRIGAALEEHELSYSRFINGITKAGITIDRKVMADLALHDKGAFAALVTQAKAKLAA